MVPLLVVLRCDVVQSPFGSCRYRCGNIDVTVTECYCPVCESLCYRGYKCFKHNLTKVLQGSHLIIARVSFTLQISKGERVEIHLYDGYTKVETATYYSCMGDICVYFYDGTSSNVEPATLDTVPLMLHYNKRFYRPCSRDDYFTKWVCVPELDSLGDCCSISHYTSWDCTKVVGQLICELDTVNEALNRIDLDKSTCEGYGLPDNNWSGYKLHDSVGNERIKVVTQKPSNGVYERVIHRTTNGFRIGPLTYIKDNCTITATTVGSHKGLVITCQWNTVVAYYSVTDNHKQLPQLIVILKTDNKVTNGTPVKVSSQKYGYYILATNGGTGYEYKWVEVKEAQGVTLDEKTDFTLLNTAIILVHWTSTMGGSYTEPVIKNAIQTAIQNNSLAKSPGRDDDINRLTGRTITVSEESTGSGTAPGKCLGDTKFKVMTHNLRSLVNLSGTLRSGSLSSVTLITSLKFLIPTPYGPYSYRQIKLFPGDDIRCIKEDRHYWHTGTKIQVIFYDQDPRPLLLCCNGLAYRAMSMGGYDKQEWHKVEGVDRSPCVLGKNGPCAGNCQNEALLKAVTEVVGFLNTVNLVQHPNSTGTDQNPCQTSMVGGSVSTTCASISPAGITDCKNGSNGKCTYTVHTFKGKEVKIEVTCCTVPNTNSDPNGRNNGKTDISSCYKKLIHKPIGTNGSGAGFRLGDLIYPDITRTGKARKLDYYGNGSENGRNTNLASKANRWAPLESVTAYFYNADTEYADPLLVELVFATNGAPDNNNKEYYRLDTRDTGRLEWTKVDNGAKTGLEKGGDTLTKYLDRIRYCLKYVVRIHLEYNGTGNKYDLMGRKGSSSGTGTPSNGQFDQEINGKTQVNVKVEECPGCPALSSYKCVKHNLTSALTGKHHQVAGLAFTLPGNKGAGGNEVIEIPLYNGVEGQDTVTQSTCPSAQGPPGAPSPGTCSPTSKTTTGTKITPLYNKCMGDIFVFFYGCDPRPLMLCYNKCWYRPMNKDCYFKAWVKVQEVADCDCSDPSKCCTDSTDQCGLLPCLVEVSNFLNPVALKIAPKCSGTCKYYFVDEFNGRRILIRVKSRCFCDESFCYKQYTHSHAGINGNGCGFRLGDIYHGDITCENNRIRVNGDSKNTGCTDGKCISASDISDDKCRASQEVVVFYYKGDKTNQHPLLVALKKSNANGGTTKYSPYYELQKKVGPTETKCYTKGKNNGKNGEELNLDDTTKLTPILDSILFNISKKLQIMLGKRPEATKYSEVKDTKNSKEKDEKVMKELRGFKRCLLTRIAKDVDTPTQSSLLHHVITTTKYQAQLSNGQSSSPPNLEITVEEIPCSNLQAGGYRCFKHVLTSAVGIEEVGGLKLCIFDKGGKAGSECGSCGTQGGGSGSAGQGELQLCIKSATSSPSGRNGTTCPTNGYTQIPQLTYTTCKGDLYVIFYGDDPRPLMLCYDKQAYRPLCMGDYCTKWYRVTGKDGGVNCFCTDQPPKPGSLRFNPALLPYLYEVSLFMNPVKLCMGSEVYNKLVPKKPPTKPPEYTIHEYPPHEINVRVTAHDLKCYRQYVHQPASQGFRLGDVRYVEVPNGSGSEGAAGNGAGSSSAQQSTCKANGPPSNQFCFPYDRSKQLMSVATYYYMYDICHYWPLVVELGFKGRVSDFYRLCTKPGNGSGGDDKPSIPPEQMKWVRMTCRGEGSGGKGVGKDGDSCTTNGGAKGTNGQVNGDCKPCKNGTQNTTSQDDTHKETHNETCDKDAEFVKAAEKIENKIHGLVDYVPLHIGNYLSWEDELNDLVERRAYDIRKQLGIKYGPKDKTNLILATDDNCYEESVMAVGFYYPILVIFILRHILITPLYIFLPKYPKEFKKYQLK